MASRAVARPFDGHHARGACGAQNTLPARHDPGAGAPTPGAPRQRGLSLMGTATAVPLDEKMANSDGVGSGAGFLDTREDWHNYLAVVLIAGPFIPAVLFVRPPLRDHSDAKLAQVGRWMPATGDWDSPREMRDWPTSRFPGCIATSLAVQKESLLQKE